MHDQWVGYLGIPQPCPGAASEHRFTSTAQEQALFQGPTPLAGPGRAEGSLKPVWGCWAPLTTSSRAPEGRGTSHGLIHYKTTDRESAPWRNTHFLKMFQ